MSTNRLKKYLTTEENEDLKTITIKLNDPEDQLMKLLEFIKVTGNVGHSFSIIADPEDKANSSKFYIDGDGSFRIGSLEIT